MSQDTVTLEGSLADRSRWSAEQCTIDAALSVREAVASASGLSGR